MGPLLLALASYLDNEQAGAYLQYEPVSGDPTARVATGGALGLDFEAVLDEIRTRLVSSGSVDEPTFDWLCGNYLTWNSETSKIDVDVEALAQALQVAGHVGKRKLSGTRILSLSFAGSDSGLSSAAARTNNEVEVAAVGISIQRGTGFTNSPVRVTLTLGVTPAIVRSFDIASGESQVFASFSLPSELYGTEITVSALPTTSFPVGDRLAGSLALTIREVTHALDLSHI